MLFIEAANQLANFQGMATEALFIEIFDEKRGPLHYKIYSEHFKENILDFFYFHYSLNRREKITPEEEIKLIDFIKNIKV